jgi:hypothetical protein
VYFLHIPRVLGANAVFPVKPIMQTVTRIPLMGVKHIWVFLITADPVVTSASSITGTGNVQMTCVSWNAAISGGMTVTRILPTGVKQILGPMTTAEAADIVVHPARFA